MEAKKSKIEDKRKNSSYSKIQKSTQIKSKKKVDLHCGIIHIHSSRNNTIATLSNLKGNVIFWSSGGSANDELTNKKFKGFQKRSENAAYNAISTICKKAKQKGIIRIVVYLKGYGKAMNIIFKCLKHHKIILKKLIDVTPISLNGCKAPKKHRKKKRMKKR